MRYARKNGRGWSGRAAIAGALGLVALLVWGCSEPVTTYQVAGRQLSGGEKVLVLPFQDTRTFTDPNDEYRETLGQHGRDIFVAAMRQNPTIDNATILTPDVTVDGSLTIAQIADLGRLHGADVVVAGQVFSFTETRAASIPPRAGMFVRVVSAKNGSLLFVGDHYLSASVPGASGGREQQAILVANRLLDSIVESVRPLVAQVASHAALAMLAAAEERGDAPPADPHGGDRDKTGNSDEPAPLPTIASGSLFDSVDWDNQPAPELPSVISFSDDLYQAAPKPLPLAEKAEPEPVADKYEELASQPLPIIPDLGETVESAEAAETVEVAENAPAEEAEVAESPGESDVPMPLPPPSLSWDEEDAGGLADADVPALIGGEGMTAADLAGRPVEPEAEVMAETSDNSAEPITDDLAEVEAGTEAEALAEADVPLPSGDELALDLFESQGEVELAMRKDTPAEPAVTPTRVEPVATDEVAEPAPVAAAVAEEAEPEMEVATESRRIALAEDFAFSPDMTQSQFIAAMEPQVGIIAVEPEPVAAAPAYEPKLVEDLPSEAPVLVTGDTLYEPPVAFEQPRPIKLLDNNLPEDPTAALVGAGPETVVPTRFASPGAVRVLMLPYHDRDNPNNLIPHTGGGEVVTSLFGSQLAMDPGIQILWDSTGTASHASLVSIEDALEMARKAKADYVVRGQVVEFRRAQSVPSFYSVVISTAVLAAQIFFAEMSGVDVATEIYRVSDGACIMSRRDRSQQKYVVQAEKTVRRMAEGMAKDVALAMTSSEPELMDPLIDELSPVTVLTNP